MGEEEVAALAHVLVYVPELKYLKLDKNPLGRGMTELIKCLRSSPQLSDLKLRKVQLTKKEAIELCTSANERNMDMWSDYHVSFSVVICIICARNTQNLLVGEKESFFKGDVSPLSSILKETHFCKRKLVE